MILLANYLVLIGLILIYYKKNGFIWLSLASLVWLIISIKNIDVGLCLVTISIFITNCMIYYDLKNTRLDKT